MRFPLDWLLLNKWLWITVLGCSAVLVGPLFIIYLMLILPGPIKTVAIFGIIIGGGITSGYKDWILARRQEEKPFREGPQA